MEKPTVLLRDVHIFQGKQMILHDVNLEVMPGEFVYLIGKTGSGKSSLLKTIYGALPLPAGQAEVAGFNLARLNRRSIPRLRRRLGIVFQEFNLLSDRNVHDNLLFVLRATGWKKRNEREARILDTLEQVGLEDKAYQMPHQLSGGEQQRVVIARALLNDPALIIADEPTGNLDPETSDGILMLLWRLARERGTSVLFATHDYRILETFPARIIRVQHGRLQEEKDFKMN